MRYERPDSVKDAVALLAGAKENAYLLAGGSDLLVRMRGGYIEPELIVDIKSVKGLDEIVKNDKGFRIGASVPCVAMGEHKALSKAWPGVVEASNLIGSKQIQGRCTIAGNLCNASPAADSVPALVAAGAKAVIAGPSKKRRVAVEKVVTAPGRTSLEKGEMVEAILLDKPSPRSGDAYLRFIPRTEMDIAVVSAGVALTLDAKGLVKSARVALGAVAPTVVLVKKAASAIIGTKLEDDALEKMAEACAAACNPIDDKRGTIDFRKKVSGVLAKRAAKIAYERAGGK
ncbi:MAG: xanthine dehydrogenase family protein subunit M [Pseudomonadota bacterium]